MSEIKCPVCGSTQITANKTGFSLGKALVGGVLLGGVGLLAGALGKNKITITCLNCGHQWEPCPMPTSPDANVSSYSPTSIVGKYQSTVNPAPIANYDQYQFTAKTVSISNSSYPADDYRTFQKLCQKHEANGNFYLAVCFALDEAFSIFYSQYYKNNISDESALYYFEQIVGPRCVDTIRRLLAVQQISFGLFELKELIVKKSKIRDFSLALSDFTAEAEKMIQRFAEEKDTRIFTFRCPYCEQKYEGDHTYVHADIECTYCGNNIQLIPVEESDRLGIEVEK